MSRKYKAYPEYKDSGVEWLGEIPGHWDVLPIKYLSKSIGTGGTPKHESSFTDEQELNWFTPSDFSNHMNLTVSSKYVTTESVNSGDAKVFASGSVAVIGIGATLGKVSYCPTVFSCNQQINVVTPGNNVSGKYLVFALSVQTEQMKQVSNASTIGIMNQEKMKNLLICSPPLKEIDHIDTFLDHETAKIDTLIEEQKTLIRLLQEKRQAVISHAVTKGLNPDAPMKDSGVEWLGEVPEHWNIERIANLYKERVEAGDPNLPVLTVSIHHGISNRELGVDESDRKIVRIEDKTKYKRVYKNDLAYNMMRAWQGGLGAAEVEGLVSPAYVVACPIKKSLSSSYFEAALRTPNGIEEIRRYSRGITEFRLRIYWEEFRQLALPVPPAGECAVIMEYISQLNEQVKRTKEEVERQIVLLQERRTALISAAVTGKIDVRDWTPPAPQQEQQQEMALCN